MQILKLQNVVLQNNCFFVYDHLQKSISTTFDNYQIFIFKNLITHFVWYLGKEKSYDIETLSTDRILKKEDFYGKVMQKMWTKS